MSHPPHRRVATIAVAAIAGVAATAVIADADTPAAARLTQPTLSSRSVPILQADGISYRDLDRSGTLTPYEDWRLSAQRRAADLLSRMTLEQKAGLLVHGTLSSTATGYNAPANAQLIGGAKHMTTFITRLAAAPRALAEANNGVQEQAEAEPLGIPALISTDPRNGFSVTQGQTVQRVGTTAFPDFDGMGAAGDPALTKAYGDVVRREYRAVGIQEGLSPQADLATEPRWTRIDGTFGSDPEAVKAQVQAYIEGAQGGDDGAGPDGAAQVVKHFAGYGAQVNGYDSHYYYGRFAAFPGGAFAQHLIPYEGAFAAGADGVMPTYSILQDLQVDGRPVEQVGAGFNRYLLQDLLRTRFGFDGVVVSDFGITGNCPAECQANQPPSSFIGSWGVGMPWGVEGLSVVQRFGKAIEAGVDQVGGSNEPANVVQAVQDGVLSQTRVDQAAAGVLEQKVELGLFESPYVDAGAAATTAGTPELQRIGDEAQARSLTLLRNEGDVLPVDASARPTAYLNGVSADAARARGLRVVSTPGEADLAIVRLTDPRGGADLTDLDFKGTEPDFQALKAAHDAGVPTVAVPKLSRPLILTEVERDADAVLANYGVSDEVLLDTIIGARSPGGRLPFELPSSPEAVDRQQPDVPNDSVAPLHPVGFGLSYATPEAPTEPEVPASTETTPPPATIPTTPTATQVVPAPSTPAPAAPPAAPAKRATPTLGRARVAYARSARRLTVALRPSLAVRATVSLQRRSTKATWVRVARGSQELTAGPRTLSVRLRSALRRGTYRVVVAAATTQGDPARRQVVTLRVRR